MESVGSNHQLEFSLPVLGCNFEWAANLVGVEGFGDWRLQKQKNSACGVGTIKIKDEMASEPGFFRPFGWGRDERC